MSNKLTVGVMFRNNDELVRPWFYFLRKSTIMDLTVIAVDQGSTDGTVSEITLAKDKKDTLVSLPNNIGIAGGRNVILKELRYQNNGDYANFLLLDSDVFITLNDSVNRMVDTMVTDDKVGCVYATVRSYWDTNDISFGICMCLLRKEVFERIGEFDAGFKMFWDDSDFIHRMKKSGFRTVLDKRAECIHMWGETTKRGSEKGVIRSGAIEHDKKHYEKNHNVVLDDLPPGWK